MKHLLIITVVIGLISAQVVFPSSGDSSNKADSTDVNNNSNDVDALLFAATSISSRDVGFVQLRDGDQCSLPDGTIGTCIRLSQCSSYSHLFSDLNNPQTLRFLRERVCRFVANSVNICCPLGNNPIVTQPTTRRPVRRPVTQPTTRRPLQTTLRPSNLPHVPSSSQNSIFPTDCGRTFADRIIEGTEIPVGAYPWLVALGRIEEGIFDVNCGGTLITTRHVITAAHCFARFVKPTHAIVGEHDVNRDNDGANPETHFIRRIVLSNYNENTNQDDIAILTMSRDVTFNRNIQPICLPFRPDLSDNTFVGNRLDVVGWGRTDHQVRETSPVPLEAKVEVVSLDDCNQAYANLPGGVSLTITNRQLCAGRGGADTCSGDSGGPIHYLDQRSDRYYLAGVTSFGFECGNAQFPGVYTRVSSYLNWIQLNVN